jgi:hypothetical protein
MAVPDDLRQLAQEDVVYLTRFLVGVNSGSTAIYRGRLHQALSGNWVLNTSTGQNGVIGIDLGQPGGNWSSADTPVGGLQITISYLLIPQGPVPVGGSPALNEMITLMSVIPADLAD